MKRILIIEDDVAISKGLQVALENKNYRVAAESNGEKGFLRALQSDFDLILLDLMLPGKDGEEICRDLRGKGLHIPIIVLTARTDEIDEITLLKMGADNYLKKPVSIHKLLAYVESALRRAKTGEVLPVVDFFQSDDLYIDFKKQEAFKDKQPIELSTREFETLRYLLQRAGEVVSRDDILDNVWEDDAFPTPRTVDNCILKIRKKIEDDPANPQYIITYYRSGYKFIKSADES
jgi:DNA-binding response OmpR family regulator